MSIFRVNKSKNFTIINNHILRNRKASLKAKGLLSWMLSCDDEWNFSLEGMQRCLKEGEDAIKSALKELEELGYLNRTKLMPESYTNENGEKVVVRSQIEYIYNIYEQPQQVDIQATENQHTDFQYVESQSTENPTQRNTNIEEVPKYKEELKSNKEPVPALSSDLTGSKQLGSKRNFRKEHEELEDKLQSGKVIDEEKSKKKMSSAEKTRHNCLAEIDSRNYDDETKALLKEYYIWASSGNDSRRIKSLDLWRSKLDMLDQLIKKGGDSKKIVNQSLNNHWYKFIESENIHKQTVVERMNEEITPDNRTKEEILAEIAYNREHNGVY